MKPFALFSPLGCLLLVTALPAGNPSDKPRLVADLVLTGGTIWTVDPSRPEAEAVAIRRDRILAVGSSADVQALAGPATRVIDLKGRRVVPGFYDSHVHMLASGMRLGEVALKDAKDEAEFGQRLRDFDRKLPLTLPSKRRTAARWSQASWPTWWCCRGTFWPNPSAIASLRRRWC